MMNVTEYYCPIYPSLSYQKKMSFARYKRRFVEFKVYVLYLY